MRLFSTFFQHSAQCTVRCLLFITTLLIFASGRANATDYFWGGAVSTDWNTAANWFPNGVPGAGDSATIGAQRVVNASQAVTIAQLTLAPASELQGSGLITVTDLASLTDVKLSGTGALKVASGAVMNLNSTGTYNGLVAGLLGFLVNTVINLLVDKPIINSGTINWNGGNLKIGANWQNNVGAVFDVRTDGVLAQNTLLAVTLTNNGTLLKSSSGTTTIAPTIQNSGTVQFLGGTLDAKGGLTQNSGFTQFKGGNLSAPTFALHGGKIGGIGTLMGNLQNDGGIVAPGFSPGTIVINGNYTQSATGALDMEIGGLTAGTQYDQLVVNGTMTFGGTLNIAQYNGFTPSAGNSFQLIKYYSSSGSFASTNNVFTTSGIYFTTTKTPSYLVAQTYADTSKPSVVVSSPTANSAKASFASVTGTASDSGSGLDKVTVRLYRYAAGSVAAGYWNGTAWDASYDALKHERAATGTSSWSFSLPTLSQGQYSVCATATDKAKNSVTTAEVIFWVDNTAPASVNFVAPVSGSTVSDLSTVTIAASDAGSGIGSVTLQIKNSSNSYWTGSAWSSKTANLTTSFNGTNWTRSNCSTTPMPAGSSLAVGTYQLSATATDRTGLTRTITIGVTVAAKTTKAMCFALPRPAPTPDVELSLAEAQGNQVQLYFVSPLRAIAPQSFALHTNGAPIFVTGVNTNGVALTLHLSRTLWPGERLILIWRDLNDSTGNPFSKQTTIVVK